MSKYKYVKVSLEELDDMPHGAVRKAKFYYHFNKDYLRTDRLVIFAEQDNLYIRKKLEWYENIPKHGVHVWYKDEVYLVSRVEGGKCFMNGDFWLFEMHDCTTLTDEEVVKYFTGVKGE